MNTVRIEGEVSSELWQRLKERTGASDQEIIANMASFFDWAVTSTLQHETIASFNELARASRIVQATTPLLQKLQERAG